MDGGGGGGGGELRQEIIKKMKGWWWEGRRAKALHPAATSPPSVASDGGMHACVYLHYHESIENTSIALSQRLIKSSHNDF